MKPTNDDQQRLVRVPGISCAHCVATIEREVGELEGVTRVDASLEDRSVAIEWDSRRVNWVEIERLMGEIGYSPMDPEGA